jgi:hypothetical protein
MLKQTSLISAIPFPTTRNLYRTAQKKAPLTKRPLLVSKNLSYSATSIILNGTLMIAW